MNYPSRIRAIQQTMAAENADWFIVTNLNNIRYLTGFTGSYAVLAISADRPCILTDGRYAEQVRREVNYCKAEIQGNRKEMQALRDIVGDTNGQTIWFEGEHMTVTRYTALCEAIPARAYIAKRNVVEGLRAVKDAEEIDAVRRALLIAEEAFVKALDIIREGMTERELAHFLFETMWRAGAVKNAFDPLILFGARSSMCHGKPSDNTLKNGDIVLMDFGCLIPEGYQSDITRTVFFGQPTDEKKHMYETVKAANLAAEKQLRAGIGGVRGDEFAREIIRQAGRVEQFVHGLGHGVGLEIHEAPRLSPLSEHDLASGNVVTVEPGVYIAGTGGVRIEDMVVIRENECEVLNRATKEMIVL